jgi:hypothetical protein
MNTNAMLTSLLSERVHRSRRLVGFAAVANYDINQESKECDHYEKPFAAKNSPLS